MNMFTNRSLFFCGTALHFWVPVAPFQKTMQSQNFEQQTACNTAQNPRRTKTSTTLLQKPENMYIYNSLPPPILSHMNLVRTVHSYSVRSILILLSHPCLGPVTGCEGMDWINLDGLASFSFLQNALLHGVS